MDHIVASQLIDRIYACALGPADWAGVLNEMADFARADVAWLGLIVPDLGIAEVLAPRTDPDFIRQYQSHWWTKDPMLPFVARAPVGKLCSLADVGRSRVESSEFFADFWRHSGHAVERLSTNLVTISGGMARIGIQPSRRSESIEPELVAAFALLTPHLVRSVQISCAIRRAKLELEAARSAPDGVLMVDAEARLVIADKAGRQALAGNAGIRVDNGRVVLPTRQSTERLHSLIRQCRPSPLPINRCGTLCLDDADLQLRIDVVPFLKDQDPVGPEHVRYPRPLAMLLLRDQAKQRQAAQTRLRERFGLTPAETEVAFELMRGEGRAVAAARLGVSLATVRTHMMHVFSKVGISTQAALVRRMHAEGVTLHDPMPSTPKF